MFLKTMPRLPICLIFVILLIFGKSLTKSLEQLIELPTPIESFYISHAKFQGVDISSLQFQLFTVKCEGEPEHLFIGDVNTLTNSNFIRNQPLKILVHGFHGNLNHDFPRRTCEELLLLDPNQNIILVNWATLASGDYFGAVSNAKQVSRQTTDLINFLVKEVAVRSQDIHLIGLSLGGQIVGQIGSGVAEKVGRVTGLDPASPLFKDTPLDNHIDPSDALFVDIIHTAGGFLGIFEPMGAVDWYPNGGIIQPGCGDDQCSHVRATDLFTESIGNPAGFIGVQCPSWEAFQSGSCNNNEKVSMGYHTPLNASGSFFSPTRASPPYAEG